MIAAFNGKQTGKHVVQIACGSTYSAAITADGELYTWGRGNYGRLGHGKIHQLWTAVRSLKCSIFFQFYFCLLVLFLGSSEDQTTPMLVTALKGLKVMDVACGSGDAQTLSVTENGKNMSVLAWLDFRF